MSGVVLDHRKINKEVLTLAMLRTNTVRLTGQHLA
jgi:hypothetical protein